MLPKKEFDFIYSRVPRFGIELIIIKDNKILLTKRTIEPLKNSWHIPGTTLAYKETLSQLLKRTAKEVNGQVIKKTFKGTIQYISKDYHVVSLVYEVELKGNLSPDHNASQIRFFNRLPSYMFPEQRKFIKKHYESIILNE